MIGYVKGKVIYYTENSVILENNGIGYEITCSAEVYKTLIEKKEGAVYTYMAVREDGISLYGFVSPEEKNMFLKLISVSGVGPKMGITVLSNMRLSDLAVKIAQSDVKGLSSVKGLGKKTAERIILELREKIVEDGITAEDSSPVLALPKTEENDDAVIALMSLGFTRAESEKSIATAKASGAETLEQLIAFALKNIR